MLRWVALEDAGLRLDDLGERPERNPIAVRERASLPPRDEVSGRVDSAKELEDNSALADSGHADECDELRRALRAHACQ